MPDVIGVFGGTFDPVHNGHLRPVLEVTQALGLAQVRLIPCHIPPHRGPPWASPAQRLTLLHAAVQGEPRFIVDERELQRAGPSYTVDTLLSLRAELGTVPLCLMLGMDAFCHLPTWHRWSELIGLAHLIVMHRPGWSPPAHGAVATLLAQHGVNEKTGAALRTAPAGHVLLWPVAQLEISATGIRAQLQAGQSPRYLLPDAVLQIIEQQGWYR